MGDLRAHKDDDIVINNMTKLSLDTDSSRFKLHLVKSTKTFSVLCKLKPGEKGGWDAGLDRIETSFGISNCGVLLVASGQIVLKKGLSYTLSGCYWTDGREKLH